MGERFNKLSYDSYEFLLIGDLMGRRFYRDGGLAGLTAPQHHNRRGAKLFGDALRPTLLPHKGKALLGAAGRAARWWDILAFRL